jgi:signal transduction histidine kinase/DNA-binding response OmpR family regulator
MIHGVILVIDDNPTTRTMLRAALEDEGYRVLEAGTGVDALGAMQHHDVDLVLQDWVLPDIGGLELARSLRALPGGIERPLLAMSGFRRMLEETRGMPGMFDGVLVKPVELSTLLATLREHLPQAAEADNLTAAQARQARLASELAERSAMQNARLAILGGIADALSRSTDAERILGDALASCLDAGGISKGALFKATRRGGLIPAHSIGFSAREESQLGTLFGNPGVLENLIREPPSPTLSVSALLSEPTGLHVSALIPCAWDRQIVGALFFGSNVPHVTEQDLLAFGRAMATYVSQAIQLSGAFASLQESAETSRRLFASLDVAETMETLVQVATARLADLCEVRLVDGDGTTHGRRIRHVDGEQHRHLADLVAVEAGPPPDFLANVLRGGRCELVRYLSPEAIEWSGEPYAAMMKECGARSRIVVPLVARKRVVGTLMLVTSRLRPYDDSDLGVAEDLARRASVAIDNGRLYQEMRAASVLKDEFLATVSHELRTPLNAMLGWARVLRQGRLDDTRTAKALETIERNAVLQSQLVEDLLDLSQMVTGRLRLTVRLTDLAAVTRAALDSIRTTAAAKQIELIFSAEGEPLYVLGDANRLQQVAWNLLSNAVKFTPSGGRIEVAAERSEGCARLRVSDSGIGIDEHFLPFVFERFKQGDGRYSRQWGGLGIGLAICSDLVTLHGGQIRAQSEGRGHGATLEVTLPLASDATVARARTAPPATQKVDSPGPWPELRKLKVLIVEDEPDGRELLFHVLERQGAVPSVAESSAEALSVLMREVPDVLVADIGLPGEDGYTMIRKIRSMAEAAGGRVPAVALTACARPQDRIEAVSAGYQMHVSKPVDPDHLLAVVANLARMAAERKRDLA